MRNILNKAYNSPGTFYTYILIGLSIVALAIGTATGNIFFALFPAFVAPFYSIIAMKHRKNKQACLNRNR